MTTKRRPWREMYRVHLAADAFPMMSDEELHDLGEDIKQNGLIHPIVLWLEDGISEWRHGEVIDGRNRLEAIHRAGLDVGPEDIIPAPRVIRGDAIGYATSANEKRRHLTGAQKRGVIEKLLKLAPDRSNRQIAKDVGVDHKTVGAVRNDSEASGEIPQSPLRVGRDGRRTKAGIGRPLTVIVDHDEPDEEPPAPKSKPKPRTKTKAPQKKPRPLKAVPGPPAEPPSLESSSASREEKERYRLLKQGTTVVAHGPDKHLIHWAEKADLLVRIDRQSPWANPFLTPDDGDQKTVVENYRDVYLPHKPSLQKRLPDLRGKALACSCAQPPCHGYVLRDLAEAAPTTV